MSLSHQRIKKDYGITSLVSFIMEDYDLSGLYFFLLFRNTSISRWLFSLYINIYTTFRT